VTGRQSGEATDGGTHPTKSASARHARPPPLRPINAPSLPPPLPTAAAPRRRRRAVRSATPRVPPPPCLPRRGGSGGGGSSGIIPSAAVCGRTAFAPAPWRGGDRSGGERRAAARIARAPTPFTPDKRATLAAAAPRRRRTPPPPTRRSFRRATRAAAAVFTTPRQRQRPRQRPQRGQRRQQATCGRAANALTPWRGGYPLLRGGRPMSASAGPRAAGRGGSAGWTRRESYGRPLSPGPTCPARGKGSPAIKLSTTLMIHPHLHIW